MSDEAAQARKKMLVDLYYTTELCDCEWPLRVYRNGHGHSGNCPWVTQEHQRDADPGTLAKNLRKRAAAFGVPRTSMMSTTGSLLFEAANEIEKLQDLLAEVLACIDGDDYARLTLMFPEIKEGAAHDA